jgi:hypothetical protein
MKESKRPLLNHSLECDINRAIIAEAWHPKRMARWIEMDLELEEL